MYKYYRHPRTTQEARRSLDEEHAEYVRPKRNKANLPNLYDDKPNRAESDKSWKRKRKHQNRVGSRGRLNVYSYEGREWQLESRFIEYCKEHDIAHDVQYKVKKHIQWYDEYITIIDKRNVPVYHLHKKRLDGSPIIWFYTDETHKEKTGRKKSRKVSTIVATKLRWWSNTNICIEKVLGSTA